jgi:hypothetical protein
VNLSADVTEHHHLLHLSPSIKSPAEATQQTLASPLILPPPFSLSVLSVFLFS